MTEPVNKGALLLQEKTKERGAKANLARDLQVEPDVISRWLSSDRVPSPLHRRKLEDDYGISWRLWDDAADSADDEASTDNAKVEQTPAAE